HSKTLVRCTLPPLPHFSVVEVSRYRFDNRHPTPFHYRPLQAEQKSDEKACAKVSCRSLPSYRQHLLPIRDRLDQFGHANDLAHEKQLLPDVVANSRQCLYRDQSTLRLAIVPVQMC